MIVRLLMTIQLCCAGLVGKWRMCSQSQNQGDFHKVLLYYVASDVYFVNHSSNPTAHWVCLFVALSVMLFAVLQPQITVSY